MELEKLIWNHLERYKERQEDYQIAEKYLLRLFKIADKKNLDITAYIRAYATIYRCHKRQDILYEESLWNGYLPKMKRPIGYVKRRI